MVYLDTWDEFAAASERLFLTAPSAVRLLIEASIDRQDFCEPTRATRAVRKVALLAIILTASLRWITTYSSLFIVN
jgi:hypothetical protein